MSFLRKLAEGHAAEDYVCQILSRAGYAPHLNETPSRKDLSKFDLCFDFFGRQVRLEAKLDAMASQTGNVAIEHWNPRTSQPSGIMGTRAELWVQVFLQPLGAYVARTRDVRKFMDRTPPARSLQRVGDGNADILLYRADSILPAIFFGLDATPPCELPRLLRHLVLEGTK